MDHQKFPIKMKKVDDETNKKLWGLFPGEKEEFLQVGPNNVLLPGLYEKEGPLFYNFQVRPDDVWIVTFPRSGTTFMQEVTWLLMNDLDYKTAKETLLPNRFPYLEFSLVWHLHVDSLDSLIKGRELNPEETVVSKQFGENPIEIIESTKGRRFIKSHLPLNLLPPDLLTCGAKVIYVARNPKDCSISYYYFIQLMKFVDSDVDFKLWWDLFETGLVPWGPFWGHIKEGWDRRNEKNLQFLFYEDLIRDTPAVIRKVASFLGKEITDQEVETLAKHMNIDNFRKNYSVNMKGARDIGLLKKDGEGFIRNGQTGPWRKMFDKEVNKRANEWIERNLKVLDIQFPDNCQLGD